MRGEGGTGDTRLPAAGDASGIPTAGGWRWGASGAWIKAISVEGPGHRWAEGNAATRTGGTAYVRSGIASIAPAIVAHTACRTPGARVRVTARTSAARAAPAVARSEP